MELTKPLEENAPWNWQNHWRKTHSGTDKTKEGCIPDMKYQDYRIVNIDLLKFFVEIPNYIIVA